MGLNRWPLYSSQRPYTLYNQSHTHNHDTITVPQTSMDMNTTKCMTLTSEIRFRSKELYVTQARHASLISRITWCRISSKTLALKYPEIATPITDKIYVIATQLPWSCTCYLKSRWQTFSSHSSMWIITIISNGYCHFLYCSIRLMALYWAFLTNAHQCFNHCVRSRKPFYTIYHMN